MTAGLALLFGLPIFLVLVLWFTEWAETHLVAPPQPVPRPQVAPPADPGAPAPDTSDVHVGAGVPPAA
jgi:hypothetical protein